MRALAFLVLSVATIASAQDLPDPEGPIGQWWSYGLKFGVRFEKRGTPRNNILYSCLMLSKFKITFSKPFFAKLGLQYK